MARKLVTQDDVFNAAMELVNSGEHPSTLKISQLLGRGSYSTITKYLWAWEETSDAQAARIDALPQEAEVPDTLMNDTQGLAKKLWHSAKTIAEDQLDIERQALEKAKADYQAEIEQAINMADAATTKKEELDELLNETLASLAASDAKVDKQATLLNSTESALTDTRQALEQLRIELKTENAEKLAIQETAISNDAALKAEQRHTQTLAKNHAAEISRLIQVHDKASLNLENQHKKGQAKKETETQRIINKFETQAQKITLETNRLQEKVQTQAEQVGEYKAKMAGAEKALKDALKHIKGLEKELA